MTQQTDLFQRLCHEAVTACGADMPAVERYVMKRIAELDEASRVSIRGDLERVLNFQQPSMQKSPLH